MGSKVNEELKRKNQFTDLMVTSYPVLKVLGNLNLTLFQFHSIHSSNEKIFIPLILSLFDQNNNKTFFVPNHTNYI
jgi:hypothetical protein